VCHQQLAPHCQLSIKTTANGRSFAKAPWELYAWTWSRYFVWSRITSDKSPKTFISAGILRTSNNQTNAFGRLTSGSLPANSWPIQSDWLNSLSNTVSSKINGITAASAQISGLVISPTTTGGRVLTARIVNGVVTEPTMHLHSEDVRRNCLATQRVLAVVQLVNAIEELLDESMFELYRLLFLLTRPWFTVSPVYVKGSVEILNLVHECRCWGQPIGVNRELIEQEVNNLAKQGYEVWLLAKPWRLIRTR